MFDIKENLKELPDKPGVYMHKDKLGQVIYVGKASSLKNRVRQYFQSSKNMDAKVRAMVSHIEEFEYITTATEMEALILECTLIKKYMPKYNVLLRDDKTYPYIKITMFEEFPRLMKTRIIEKDGGKYFGPYTDVSSVNQIIELLNSILKLKRCSNKTFAEGFKPCLNFHINQCKGVCIGNISREEYRKNIYEAINFLNGKSKPLTDYLKLKMKEEADRLHYESAAECRDYISAINSLNQKQNVVILGAKDMDVITILKGENEYYAVLFLVRDGKLSGRETYHLQTSAEDEPCEMTRAFIEQYYSEISQIPNEILVQYEIEDKPLVEEFLTTISGKRIKITLPVRGEKKAMLELVKKDAIEMAKSIDAKAINQREREISIRKEMEGLINEYDDFNIGSSDHHNSSCVGDSVEIGENYRIEAYDISNINGVDSVGAMVVFEGTKAVKKDYRRFKIRTVEGPNDYGSLQEVIYRRFNRAIAGDPGFSKIPDILFIDGGIGQVSVVLKMLNAMNIKIPVFGMAKDESHRTRGLVYLTDLDSGESNREISLKEKPLLFKYVGTIQEEVHRFAIDYHRGLRGKRLEISVLDEIEGIGKVKRNLLLAHFGSIEAIKSAKTDKLEQMKGISKKEAENIYKFFH
ncbi:MAG: excinuclease ABC subunit UvrC [Peptostreptococcaceae bacterium]|nr:excinuclease ABC subunit UvrC [Peptostreptococcaceae bacterium]